jgi:DNA-dependent RNA polymerase auxiliary subunit epsilon
MKHNTHNTIKIKILSLIALFSMLALVYYPPVIVYNDEIQSMKNSISIICKLRKYQKEQGKLPERLEYLIKINDSFLHYEKLSNQEFILTVHDGFDPTATYKSTEKKWEHWREVPFPLKEELVKIDCRS